MKDGGNHLHHYPSLTLNQRRLYLILAAEVVAAEREGRDPVEASTTELNAKLLKPLNPKMLPGLLSSLQFKLPLIPHRRFLVRERKVPKPGGGIMTVWVAARKRNQR